MGRNSFIIRDAECVHNESRSVQREAPRAGGYFSPVVPGVVFESSGAEGLRWPSRFSGVEDFTSVLPWPAVEGLSPLGPEGSAAACFSSGLGEFAELIGVALVSDIYRDVRSGLGGKLPCDAGTSARIVHRNPYSYRKGVRFRLIISKVQTAS